MGLHVLTRPARDTKDSSRGPGSPDSRGTAESTSFGAPVVWGASLRRAPAGTHGRATFKDFQLRREPRPPHSVPRWDCRPTVVRPQAQQGKRRPLGTSTPQESLAPAHC